MMMMMMRGTKGFLIYILSSFKYTVRRGWLAGRETVLNHMNMNMLLVLGSSDLDLLFPMETMLYM